MFEGEFVVEAELLVGCSLTSLVALGWSRKLANGARRLFGDRFGALVRLWRLGFGVI